MFLHLPQLRRKRERFLADLDDDNEFGFQQIQRFLSRIDNDTVTDEGCSSVHLAGPYDDEFTIFTDSCGERKSEKVPIEEGWGSVTEWECPYFHRRMPLLYVDDIKMARKTQNMPKMWAILQNNVGLDDAVSFTDQVYLGCTQRAAQVNNRIVMEKQKLFSKLISRSTDVKTEGTNLKDITSWRYDMEGHPHKCVERYCEMAHKTIDQLHKVSTLCLDDHQIKSEGLEVVREMSETGSQIVL